MDVDILLKSATSVIDFLLVIFLNTSVAKRHVSAIIIFPQSRGA